MRLPPFGKCSPRAVDGQTEQQKRRKKGADDTDGAEIWAPKPEAQHSIDWNNPLPQMPPATATSLGNTVTPTWPETSGIPQLPQQPQQSLSFDANPNPTDYPSASDSAGSMVSPSSRNRRRRSPDATRRIVAASFSNETDALEILANAAAEDDSEGTTQDVKEGDRMVRWALEDDKKAPSLEEFCLVQAKVLTTQDTQDLVRIFFERYHPVLVSFFVARVGLN